MRNLSAKVIELHTYACVVLVVVGLVGVSFGRKDGKEFITFKTAHVPSRDGLAIHRKLDSSLILKSQSIRIYCNQKWSLFVPKSFWYKVVVCYLDAFLFVPTSRRIWNTQLVQDDEQIQTMHVVIWFHNSWSWYEYLNHYQIECSKWSNRSSDHVDYWTENNQHILCM